LRTDEGKEEEMKLWRRIKVKKELRRTKREKMLNILPLVVRSPSHSSSSLECAKGKAYNEKIQFVQTIIQDIDTIGTFVVEFLCKSKPRWRAKEQIGLGPTLINLVCIEELKEDEVEEHHFVEA
jgi:hypothetical protein